MIRRQTAALIWVSVSLVGGEEGQRTKGVECAVERIVLPCNDYRVLRAFFFFFFLFSQNLIDRVVILI